MFHVARSTGLLGGSGSPPSKKRKNLEMLHNLFPTFTEIFKNFVVMSLWSCCNWVLHQSTKRSGCRQD